MKKIKILFLSHSALINGAEVCLLTLLKYLNREKHEAVVVVPTEGPLQERIETLGVRCLISPLEWWVRSSDYRSNAEPRLTLRLAALARLVDQEAPDIIHTNTSVVWEGALVARARKLPHLWHVHEILVQHPSLVPVFPLPLVFWAMDRLSRKVVPVSRAAMGQFPMDFPKEKLALIHNGVDTQAFRRETSTLLREELDLRGEGLLAVTVGSLTEGKDHDNLLRAVRCVQDEGAAVDFLIVGSGTAMAEAELLRKIQELGISERVHYLGFRSDVPRILNGADFLVLSSRQEAFPLAILEAMAVGKPVVATDSGGPTEMIEDGESGYLVQPRDPEALARRIIDMARDHRRMREMGEKAFLRFAKNFGPDVYARQFEQLYAELIGTEPQRETSGEEILWNSLLALYDSCSGKDIELRQREDSIRNLENELEVYQSQVQRLLHSHSWKVTKPLRYLASLVRGDSSAAEE